MSATSPVPYTARVLKTRPVQYTDPVAFEPGDSLRLGKHDSEYPGWIWATSVNGKQGWIPESYVSVAGDVGTALRSYTAREIAVTEGDIVSVEVELLGWAWVRRQNSDGWMPLSHLARSVLPIDLPL